MVDDTLSRAMPLLCINRVCDTPIHLLYKDNFAGKPGAGGQTEPIKQAGLTRRTHSRVSNQIRIYRLMGKVMLLL